MAGDGGGPSVDEIRDNVHSCGKDNFEILFTLVKIEGLTVMLA